MAVRAQTARIQLGGNGIHRRLVQTYVLIDAIIHRTTSSSCNTIVYLTLPIDDHAKDGGPGEADLGVVLPRSLAKLIFVSGKL